MNISLCQVKPNLSQTMFITSTGTVLFTSYTRCDRRGHGPLTVITSVDDLGSIAEIGLIKWNQNAAGSPSLYVGKNPMELRAIGKEDTFSVVFRASDRRIYRWRIANDAITLAADSAPNAPVAIAYRNTQSSSTFGSSDADVVLYVRPTGFHLLHEIVTTFTLFERLWEENHVDYMMFSNSCRVTHIFSEEPQIQPTKDNCLARGQHAFPIRLCDSHDSKGRLIPCQWSRTPNKTLTRFTADLTGELLRRHKYPSAYGGFSDIWKCDWLKDFRVIEVAVKVIRTNLTGCKKETESKRISRELKVWVKLEHVSVLPLYGISFDFGKFPAMVCPWLEGGTLSKYLEHHDGLQIRSRMQLLGDIADGLHYLHGCGIVHGDLTGSNVLIKHNGKACLSDFGLSRIFMEVTGSSYLTSTVRGSVRWAAPELFEIGEEQQKEPVHILPNPQTDIYSFGSIMLQVLTGKIPYHYYKNDAQVLFALYRGSGPVRPVEPPIDDGHWEFMQQCWVSQNRRTNKNIRPSIEEVVNFLSLFIDDNHS